jgi:glycosyltransferase involved in cell wall biosynthesis
MIHFFLSFSKDAANSPIARCIAESGIEFRIMAGRVSHQYRHKVWMVFVGRPLTAWFGIRAAFRSLVLARPAPRIVVVGTHIEALIVAILRWLVCRDAKIVLLGFILTSRSNYFHNVLRTWYFRRVFSVVDLAIVHSSIEAARYADIFRGLRTRFTYVPWGTHVNGLEALRQADRQRPAGDQAYVLSAGRSGRDYPCLFNAFHGSARKLRVVCDLAAALKGCQAAPNIEVLDHCYGGDYIRVLWGAFCVVIPLAVDDISAGQMVLLQAMAMGKPIIITKTSTTTEYVTHDHDALLVESGDPEAIRAAVERIFAEPELLAHLSRNAEASFQNRFSIPAYVRGLLSAIHDLESARS